jgi:RES domain-containing protein
MRVWRLVSKQFADTAFDGEGAARYTGRWNPRGVRMVYTADSLALATLELSVHLAGARVVYTAIEVEIADTAVDELGPRQLTRGWQDDESVTQQIGEKWARSFTSLALLVPSILVDPRSGERNLLFNPAHPQNESVIEIQRFEIVLDERLR